MKLKLDSWIAIGGLVVTVLTFAVGYGRLSQQVSDLKEDVGEIKAALRERAAGKSLEPVAPAGLASMKLELQQSKSANN